MSTGITHTMVQTDRVHMHLASAGPADGAPVIMLHGFPESWKGWRTHMRLLADAGFRVLVPDQRGYGQSERPARVADYALDILTEDVTALMDALHIETAHIVGHDWGGAVAWQVGRTAPERVRTLSVLNCPPLDVLRCIGLRDPLQMLRSWYILWFQLPWLPEWGASLGGYWAMAQIMRHSAKPGVFTEAALAEARADWAQGGMGTMIHWYRAALRHPSKHTGRIGVPTLFLWGERDQFLGTRLIGPTEALCDDIRVVRLPDHTHWLTHEAPDRVVTELVRFFGEQQETAGANITSLSLEE